MTPPSAGRIMAGRLAWVGWSMATPRGFAEQGGNILDSSQWLDLTRKSREQIDRHRDLLDARREGGRVRQCHGDLHLRNIVLLDGRPTLFDAIEFNDEIACTACECCLEQLPHADR